LNSYISSVCSIYATAGLLQKEARRCWCCVQLTCAGKTPTPSTIMKFTYCRTNYSVTKKTNNGKNLRLFSRKLGKGNYFP